MGAPTPSSRNSDVALRLALLALAAALAPLRAAATACSGSTYSYGSGACSSCPAGASFVSASAGCTPSATLTAGPTDTAFYLSGSQAEGVGAFTATGAAPTFVAGPFGDAGGALALASGSYLSAPGASAPAALPTGNAAWSVSAWVKCAAPATWAGVLEWGVAGDVQGSLSPQLAALSVSSSTASVRSFLVTTIAGTAGSSGTLDAQGTAARFNNPSGVTIDTAGNVYVSDTGNHVIRKVLPTSLVSTFAGAAGISGSLDGVGTAARFKSPAGIAVDAAGNVFVVDSGNQVIRKIVVSGEVSTLAGTAGSAGILNGQGSAARFNTPLGISISAAGNIYVTDSNSFTLRMVTPTGFVSTLAGAGYNSGSVDGQGSAARFYNPAGIAVDTAGNVYVADDNFGNTIRMVSPTGLVSTLAGAPGASGNSDGQGDTAKFYAPFGVAVDAAGTVYVSERFNSMIRMVSPTGLVSTLAGSAQREGSTDGLGFGARFKNPKGIAVDSAGNIFIADTGNHIIRKMSPVLSFPACDSTWRHAALTYSAMPSTVLSLFVDGVLQSTSPLSVSLPSLAFSNLHIGWGGNLSINAGSLFSGELAELRIYGRALLAAEVVLLSQPPLASYGAFNVAQMTLPLQGTRMYNFVCAAGYIGAISAIVRSSADGSWAFRSAPQCTPCAAGSWAAQGTTACAPCSPGTYSLVGSAFCTLCPAGTFGSSAGLKTAACSGACASCAAGATSPVTLSCASMGARAAPPSLGLLLWPAAHPLNPQGVDLITAPLGACQQLTSASACSSAATILGADGALRYVVGTAAALHFEAAETIACSAS